MPESSNYRAGIGSDGKHYVSGPGNGMGYYSGTLYPELRLSSEDDAKAAARMCNEAWRQGYAMAQHDIRKSLGI